jgi:hypothetical protein
MSERMNMVLPAGRLVSGSLTEQNKTDHQNKPLPEDKWHYYFAVAVPKGPEADAILSQLYQIAVAGYQQQPAVLNSINQGLAGPFAWKVNDGDQLRADGSVNDHTRGCYVFRFSTQYPPRACNNQNVEIDPREIERGYYVDVSFSSSVNGATGAQAGIYLNPNIVRLLGFGERIMSGPTPDQAFADRPAALPAGASATPVAGPMPAQQPQQPMGGGMPAQQPMGGGMPAQQPQQPMSGNMPAPGMPTNAGGQPAGLPGVSAPQGAAMQTATGYPSNVQPHNGFVNGPQQ